MYLERKIVERLDGDAAFQFGAAQVSIQAWTDCNAFVQSISFNVFIGKRSSRPFPSEGFDAAAGLSGAR